MVYSYKLHKKIHRSSNKHTRLISRNPTWKQSVLSYLQPTVLQHDPQHHSPHDFSCIRSSPKTSEMDAQATGLSTVPTSTGTEAVIISKRKRKIKSWHEQKPDSPHVSGKRFFFSKQRKNGETNPVAFFSLFFAATGSRFYSTHPSPHGNPSQGYCHLTLRTTPHFYQTDPCTSTHRQMGPTKG